MFWSSATNTLLQFLLQRHYCEKGENEGNDMTGLFYRDLQRSGKCHALANKQRKAKSYFIKAFKNRTVASLLRLEEIKDAYSSKTC